MLKTLIELRIIRKSEIIIKFKSFRAIKAIWLANHVTQLAVQGRSYGITFHMPHDKIIDFKLLNKHLGEKNTQTILGNIFPS
jgi:hypothetical protein